MIACRSWPWNWPEGSQKAAIMARGQRQRVIVAAQKSIPGTYHYKQILTYLLIGFQTEP